MVIPKTPAIVGAMSTWLTCLIKSSQTSDLKAKAQNDILLIAHENKGFPGFAVKHLNYLKTPSATQHRAAQGLL
jgi:hypothetical protein